VFRPLTPQEDADAVARINASGAGLVFVGLALPEARAVEAEAVEASAPRQIHAKMLGVGAAFDFRAGTVSPAPA
jgi:N-acetylglucosaminyldiphosphoundecaprenol N-acetyl-beta-D-mannosaminyltransferase